MKNLMYTLLLVTVSLSISTAQTEKGRWTVGAQVGDINYSRNPSSYRSRTFRVSLSPSAGYFVADNFVVGLTLPVDYSHYQVSVVPNSALNFAEVISTQVGLAPFARLYIGKAKLRPFVDASVGYSQQWFSSTNFNSSQETRLTGRALNYSASAGVAYFINRSLSLDASLRYSGGDQLNQTGFASDYSQPGTFGLNVGFRLFLGR